MSNAYDAIPYPTGAQSRLHIENLHLCAFLNGFSPAAEENARVLEIGCGNGFNLAPMAVEFPDARFLGVDFAASAIETGKHCISALGLPNIELRCADLRSLLSDDVLASLGEFDYIIAHGFYSWVDHDVREAMWELVSRILAPRGILHLSYNALPGWYQAQTVRDLAGLLSGEANDPPSELDRVWDALGVFGEYADSGNVLAVEASRIRRFSKNVLFHDELSAESKAFYLTDVVRRARAAGLRYVAEAGAPAISDLRNHADVAQLVLDLSPDDLLLRLQLLDFTAMRRFHDTLFAREGHTPEKRHVVNKLLDCWARSDIRLVETVEGGARVFEHSGGVRLTSSHPMLCNLAAALEAAAPGSISLGAFLAKMQESLPSPSPELTLQFGHLIVRLRESGVLRLRLRNVQVAHEVGTHPRVPPFTRVQAAVEMSAPNCYHACLGVTEAWHRALLTLLDGTRSHNELAEGLADLTWQELSSVHGEPEGTSPHAIAPMFGFRESATFSENPERAQSRGSLLSFYREELPRALAGFLRNAFLV